MRKKKNLEEACVLCDRSLHGGGLLRRQAGRAQLENIAFARRKASYPLTIAAPLFALTL